MHNLLLHVLDLMKRGGALALGVIIGCLIAILILRLITRKNNENFPWKRLAPGALTAGYLALVAMGTLLIMSGGGRLSLRVFAEFIEAWNTMSTTLWLNIVLNIAMFIPAGILFPLVFPKLDRWYKVTAAGAGMSFVIELLQLILNRGAADIDDLITNTLGCVIGYSLLAAFRALRKKEKRWFVPLACPLSVALIALGVFGVYQAKEFGNLDCLPYFRVNTRGIEWSYDFTPDENETEFLVCKSVTLDKKGAEEFARLVEERLGARFDEVYYYDNEIWFMDRMEKERKPRVLKISYPDGFYELGEMAFRGEKIGLPKADVLEKLRGWGIDLPGSVDCVFNDGVCTLTASMIEVGGNFIDGTVKVLFDGDGNIAKIRNSVSTLTPYRTVKVVSESEAARRLERGDFSYGGAFEYDRPEKVEVVSVRLVGKIDSKGFCRPVYLFNIEGTTTPAVFVSAD